MSIVVISTDGSLSKSAACLDLLRDAGFDAHRVENREVSLGGGTEGQLIDMLKDAVAVIAWGEKYTAQVLSSLPNLRVVARAGVGFDRVDLKMATAHNKVVTIALTANYEAVAEHALCLILAVAKSVVSGDRAIRAGRWRGVPGLPVRDKTLGIIGLGRIGRALAARATALRMNIIATEKFPDESFIKEHDIALLELDELFARSDFISIHCPLNDETRGIINARTLAAMKPGVVLVNTARGGLVVESDLVDAIRSGHLGGAGLDVLEHEPINSDNPLLEFGNVVLSPHIAGNDALAMEQMGIESAQSIIDLSRGSWPEPVVVNPKVKATWKW